MEPDEQSLFDRDLYDAALGVIEGRIGKASLRRTVGEVLEIKAGADLATHEALLKLATSKQGHLRLVTTNFDRGFEKCHYTGTPECDYAPYLPLPGKAWNSIVYLHGGLGNRKDANGDGLILTSADFGRAYITEGWASRFLTDLFRRSQAVLFVGYSVSDPAIRYIVDAFAAERLAADSHVATAYILTTAGPTQNEQTWKSRGIEPIIYDSQDHHRLLHETLRNCAGPYAAGLFDRPAIVLEYGSHNPVGALDQVAISQMTWAIRDVSGHAARRFAGIRPPAPISWLDIFNAEGLLQLGASAPKHSPAVAQFPCGRLSASLHKATEGLCGWICGHLAAPESIQWAVESGGHLHSEFAELVQRQLADDKAPDVPRGPERIWRFLATKSAPIHDKGTRHEALRTQDAVLKQPWSPVIRDVILSWLAPTIRFGKLHRSSPLQDFDENSPRSYADIELVPATDKGCRHLVDKLFARPDAGTIVVDLLSEFTEFLRSGFAYLEYFGVVTADHDASYVGRPSIDEHSQNSDFLSWATYVHLLRTAWERVAALDPARAREEVGHWARIEFPLFRRLVLWSAGKTGGMTPDESFDYIRPQMPRILWSLDTRRELIQYLGRVGPQLAPANVEALINSITEGPARDLYRESVSQDEFERLRDRAIYLRLLKLQESGVTLSQSAQTVLAAITARYPDWPHATTEKDEFVVWFGESRFSRWPGDDVSSSDYLKLTDEEVVAALTATTPTAEMIDRWRGLLHGEPRRAVTVLDGLVQSGRFDHELWSTAFAYLNAGPTRAECVRLYALYLEQADGEFVAKNLTGLAVLVNRYYHEKAREHEDSVWVLWDRILEPATARALEEPRDVAMSALNSPIGDLAEALLIKLGELKPDSYPAIPPAFRERLEGLMNGTRPANRLARLVLARSLTWLFNLNQGLTTQSLLGKFDWDTSDEARYVWLGYLMNPGITPALWPFLRPLLLKVFPHSGEFGDYEQQLYSFFAFILLNAEFTIEALDARRALTVGSSAGRAQVAWYWWRQVDSADDYGAKLYRSRLKFLLTEIWPLEQDLRDQTSSENLAELATCCSTQFPDAVTVIVRYVARMADPSSLLFSMREKQVVEQYPEATLTLLDAIIGDDIQPWAWPDLRELLRKIQGADRALEADPRFVRLNALVRQFD